jgi:hypothetical protein
MSIGCEYDESFLTDIRPVERYFHQPDDIEGLELSLAQFGNAEVGVKYAFYIHVHRKPGLNYILTGDNVAGLFNNVSDRDHAAAAFARKLRGSFKVSVRPTERVKLIWGGKADFPTVEAPFDVSKFN